MEKLLLTVREAADVLSVSRSRVYELISAEQLDSVKIGWSRRVALASVRRFATVRRRHDSRRPQGEGSVYRLPDGRWRGVVNLGWHGGKRRRKYITRGTQA